MPYTKKSRVYNFVARPHLPLFQATDTHNITGIWYVNLILVEDLIFEEFIFQDLILQTDELK
jgi:hypothetical protein